MKVPSPDAISDSDQNANIIPPSESQGAIPHASSTAEGEGPVLEVTTHSPPGLSSAETASELLSCDSHFVFPNPQAQEDLTFPVVTISAFTETGQQQSSIKVPLQRSYTGRKPVISSSTRVPRGNITPASSSTEDDDPIVQDIPQSSFSFHPERLSESSILGSSVAMINDHPAGDITHIGDAFPSPGDYEFHLLARMLRCYGTFLASYTEAGRDEWSIKVPLQRAYIGAKPAISSSLADTPCTTLGVQGILDELNATLGTSYTLDIPTLSSVLEDCVKSDYDFGTAYSRLRAVWGIKRRNTIQDEIRTREARDQEKRRNALVGNRIVNPKLEPRRVWDLYANRVVPWWSSDAFLWMVPWPSGTRIVLPVSHAWMDAKDRVDVWTPINGKEWPVPIPKDASLDLIRIEMLNLGVEYTWLDVLCLRQEGGPRDDLRAEEWKIDVPTIGCVYANAEVMIYLSGLGRPLTLKEGDLDSDCCWFRRAWTLQEIGRQRIIVGDTSDGPLHAKPIDKDGNYDTEILTRFHKQLRSISAVYDPFLQPALISRMFNVLSKMQNRVSTNPVDKVMGLAFPLLPRMIPAYRESESLEDAWTELVNAMDVENRGLVFFQYPEPGDTGTKWRPSWAQVMQNPLPVDNYSLMSVDLDEETNDSWCEGHCIEKVFVGGLAVGGAAEVDRRGELIIKDAIGTEHTFDIIARHKFPIPEDMYTLLGMDPKALQLVPKQHWIVGRRLSDKKFEKVSVFEMVNEEARRLEHLCITKQCWNILI
ncbi:uncharacterized protein BT62DRAFT_936516 [Guyanagaster necrorhizus]|uniref:Heterokaryon incompatibility domain-containing protein n=1 Tax=Guyanagaster necrorhizus TaxID=856835 RepID=A0A9P7VIV1_9AGAR|nr:uncharacterized protein BT62DRAFT_936516 [Guyanagaster necrorhizus MCA 3950]KAG7441898.1 hypothetical protein BT62DRAFT_936516 [Guyanagaster necrorhizus MCA 3950]